MCKKLVYLCSFVLVLGLFLSGVTNAADPNLVGWWRLDESSGTTARDSSGNGNDGQLNGNTQWRPGKGQVGGALEFDGATGHITIPFSESLRVLNEGDFTLSAWFKPDEIPIENKEVFQQGDGNGTGRTWLFLSSANEIRSFLGGSSVLSEVSVEAGTWYHTAVVVTEGGAIDTIRLYVNGKPVAVPPGQAGMESSEGIYYIGCHKNLTNFWDGLIDDVRLYNRVLTLGELPQVMLGVDPALASAPIPADTATDLPRDLVLSWASGEYADTHDVYLGTSFDDVNNATTTVDPAGVYRGRQSTTSYAVPERLDFGETYYWRIDEVNAPPTSHVVFKGEVWSFTIEPVAYPIAGENITATASSAHEPDMGPENTINGAGLNGNDLHSIEATDMWLSSTEPLGAWIEYELDKVYKLHEMWVWNSNQLVEPLVGMGLKDVTIEYSTNGTDYTTLGTTHEFARAPGADGYEHNTTVDLSGVVAKYVRLTANSNWGGIMPQYGLSEVRFRYIPMRAREPNPDSGATDVDLDVTLSWKAGREAAKHNIYVSTDEQAVIDGTAAVATVTETSYGPLSSDLGQTCYWRVDEVNEAETPATWQGDLWSFTTHEFLVVDDMESYNDLDPADPESRRIFNVWIDGYETPANGSLVGYENPPFCERTIVHGGRQSMPFFYSNTAGAAYSEAELPLSPPQDWTKYAVKTLSLWFFGDASNTAAQLYTKLNGSKVMYDGDAANLTRAEWQVWNIDLASFGIDLQNISKLSIGIDGNGASGKLYFDDIRLYPSR